MIGGAAQPEHKGSQRVSAKPKAKTRAESDRPSMIESVVWICLTVAALATAYFLMREPEDGPMTVLPPAMARARTLALVTSLAGALAGIWRILTRRGDPNLLAMATLFNILLATYWVLRLTLT